MGISHRSGTAALRDHLFVEEAAQPEALAGLKAAGFEQALVLSTCDRTEVQAVHAEPTVAAERIIAILAGRSAVAPAELASQAYRLTDEAALRHIFAVAASLDSLVIGEPQVLGQLKASHRIAREAGLVGGDLEAALQGAYRAAKRVRTETALAQQPVSIAAAAVQLARKVHGDLGRCSGLLIGTGEMGELMADQLAKAGLARLTVAHPSQKRAELTAQRLACHFLGLNGVPPGLEAADIIIGSLGTGKSVVTAPMIRAALKMRRRRPILLLDVAVPGDIEMTVGEIEEAFLYDLDDLERLAMQGRSTRAAAAEEAWGIVDQEVMDFLRKRDERAGVPPLIALRRHFEALRTEVLEATRPGDAEEATRLLVNKLLHDPSEMLRAMAAARRAGGPVEPEAAAQLLCAIFGLTEAECDEMPDDLTNADRKRQKEGE
ncbi:glutamyl-tRNA reductase [Virgifigura deserti]|uniref:glutamyl-tRNA reductase n=1 Tax=Virgifigura deserti TaxID=2268457 RepID=UPI003CCB9DD3